MPQGYKLRLGDGTVLLVDHDGLSIWLSDRKARVQRVGSTQWKPLKEFLAQERSAARRAARLQAKPTSTSREALPLVYPKPREESASGPPGAKVPAKQAPGSRGGDKEPIPVRADGLPLVPPPPKPPDRSARGRRRPAPASPATVVRPSLPKPPAPPVLRRPTPPEAPPPLAPPRPPDERVLARPARAPAPPAIVVRPSLPETPPAPVLARQPAGPRGGAQKPTGGSELPGISSPPPIIKPQPPINSPEPPITTPKPPIKTPEPPLITPKPPVITLKPIITLKPPIITLKPPIIAPTPPAISPKARDDRDERPTHSVPRVPAEPPAEPLLVKPPVVEPVTFSTESVPPALASDEDVGWMALPEALDDEPPSARPSRFQQTLLQNLPRAASAGETLLTHWINNLARRDWQATRIWLTSRAASVYGALLALRKSLARADRPLPSFSPGEAAPRRAVESERSAALASQPTVAVPPGARARVDKGKDSLGVYRPRRSPDDGLPLLQLEPLAEEEGRNSLGVHSPRRSPDDGLPIIELEPLDDEEGAPEIVLEPLDDEAHKTTEPAASRPAGPARREALKPAVSSRELPALPSASPWTTRRLVVMSGLVAGGLFAALSSGTWGPKAVSIGRMALSESDGHELSGDEAERQRQALQEASVQLPHLAPETIRLVLARSATGVLDPPALFQVACDAADRGSRALRPEEQLELRALRREVLDALLPSEAQRVLEYDAARARRGTFPFENRAALELFARGAYTLPSRSRARLQLLLGKAVAAQLRAEGAPRL